jgi:hypothetical protein
MPSTPTTQQMGDKHEVFLAEVFGGTKSKASGSQWSDPADGRNGHGTPFAFAWDGKSTRGKGITITREMIAKIREQALSERPALGLRWYDSDSLDLVGEDLVAIPAADMAELLENARRIVSLESAHGSLELKMATLRNQAAESRRLMEEAGERAAKAERRYEQLAEAASHGRIVPPPIPMLPWTLVYAVHLGDRHVKSGMHYDQGGKMTPFTVDSVRVERSATNLPRLIVNELLVSEGDLYTDGVLTARVSKSNPSLVAG